MDNKEYEESIRKKIKELIEEEKETWKKKKINLDKFRGDDLILNLQKSRVQDPKERKRLENLRLKLRLKFENLRDKLATRELDIKNEKRNLREKIIYISNDINIDIDPKKYPALFKNCRRIKK